MVSINLSYDITGSITQCHSDSLGLKLVCLWIKSHNSYKTGSLGPKFISLMNVLSEGAGVVKILTASGKKT